MRSASSLLLLAALAGACRPDAPPAPVPAAPPRVAAPAPGAAPPPPVDPARLLGPAAPARPAERAAGGEPDGAKVRQLFEARAAEVRRCYEAELQKRPEARGKITLRFTIAESGAVRGVSIARSTFDRDRVPACVEQVVARWTTPFRPAVPVDVEYPLSFAPR